jgi:hypothetical protein
MNMRNQNKKTKKARGHWYWFDCVLETGVYPDTYHGEYFETKLFVKSGREGIYEIERQYPGVWVLEVRRLDKIDLKDFPYIFKF